MYLSGLTRQEEEENITVSKVNKEALQADLREALKKGEKLRVSTLRLLLAAVQNKEIERRGELDETEMVSVINSAIKKRREAAEEFEKAGYSDRAGVEKEEMTILQAYLPPPLEEEELARLVDEAISEAEAEGLGDIGRVMKLVMPKVSGRADGRAVNQMVREKLA